MTDQTAAAPLFQAELTPNAPLSSRMATYVIAGAALFSLVVGVSAYAAGAWPVIGFLGLDVVALWWAFRMSARAARMREYVALTAEELRIDRAYPSGRVMSWSFPTPWVKVNLKERADEIDEVRVSLRERMLVIGSFLSPPDRRTFGDALKRAVARAQGVASV